MTDVAPDSLERAARVRRGVLLEYITLGYTSLEAVVGIIAGWMAGSVALMAFGVDSAIELISAAALVWRLHNDEPARRELKERQALAVAGASFIALAAYIAYMARLIPYRATTSPDTRLLALCSLAGPLC